MKLRALSYAKVCVLKCYPNLSLSLKSSFLGCFPLHPASCPETASLGHGVMVLFWKRLCLWRLELWCDSRVMGSIVATYHQYSPSSGSGDCLSKDNSRTLNSLIAPILSSVSHVGLATPLSNDGLSSGKYILVDFKARIK